MDAQVSAEAAPKGRHGQMSCESQESLDLPFPRSVSPRLRMQSRGAVKERTRLGSSVKDLKVMREDSYRPLIKDQYESEATREATEADSANDSPSEGYEVNDTTDTPSTTSRTVENSSPERSHFSRSQSPRKRRETHPARSPCRRNGSKTAGGAWEEPERPALAMSPRRRRVLQRYMKFGNVDSLKQAENLRQHPSLRQPRIESPRSEPDSEEDECSEEDNCPMVFKMQSEPAPTSRFPNRGMGSKACKLQLLQEESEGDFSDGFSDQTDEGFERIVRKFTDRAAAARGAEQQHRRQSFHTLGSHVDWKTLLEYAGDTPEAWSGRKVYRWLGMHEKDAFIFLSELVELRDALDKGDKPETLAGPELQAIPTPRDAAAMGKTTSSGGWFGWMFGYGGRTMSVQAAPGVQQTQSQKEKEQQQEEPSSGGFFSWLFLGASSYPKVPSTVKPMRFIHQDVVEYQLEKCAEVGLLGRGAFGQVTLVRCEVTGQLLALKAVSKGMLVEMQLQHSVMIEKAVMQATSSPFLVKMAATFNRDERLYLLLEAVMGGDLYTVYRRFNFFGSEEHARFYTACAVKGFEHLHQKRILYRDLKMENLVLDLHGYCKLCDFGTSTFEFDTAYTMCGTPEYMPPEVVCGSGHGPAADWWTLGVLVYEMIMAVTPFAEDEPLQIFAKAKAGIERVEGFNDIQTPWSDLVRGLCKQDPAKRLPMLEGGVANVCKQEWFAEVEYDWKSLEAGAMSAPHMPTCKGPEDRCNFAGEEQEVPLDLPYVDPGDEWDKGFEDAVGPRYVAGKDP